MGSENVRCYTWMKRGIMVEWVNKWEEKGDKDTKVIKRRKNETSPFTGNVLIAMPQNILIVIVKFWMPWRLPCSILSRSIKIKLHKKCNFSCFTWV
jgi:hypothetical protein